MSTLEHINFGATFLHIREDGRVLMIARRDDCDDFGLPGGKVEANECITEAVIREVLEETGMEVKDPTPVFTSQLTCSGFTRPIMSTTFMSSVVSGTPKRMPGEPRIGWGPKELLYYGSFGQYNMRLMLALHIETSFTHEFADMGLNFGPSLRLLTNRRFVEQLNKFEEIKQ